MAAIEKECVLPFSVQDTLGAVYKVLDVRSDFDSRLWIPRGGSLEPWRFK
jgi:hypothetical protein